MKNAGYWRRMKGLANSASSEILYMGWLGKMPTENIAKSRIPALNLVPFLLLRSKCQEVSLLLPGPFFSPTVGSHGFLQYE